MTEITKPICMKCMKNFADSKIRLLESVRDDVCCICHSKELIEQELIEEIPDKYYLILRNPNLLNDLNLELDKKITGEHPTRKTILIVANGRNVENPNDLASYNLMINSESGSGKDYVVVNTLSLIPDEEFVKRKRITKKVFSYWHNAKFEPAWTWNKKLFYCEDIPNSVLNEDVFKVMSSSGNATSTVIINQQAFDIQVKGKPVMIITIAEADPKSENLRRFPNCSLDEGIDQTIAVMKKHAEFAEKGIPLEYDEDYKTALTYLKRIKVRIPYASNLIKIFPEIHLILRTNFSRFLDYIKASCSLYQFQREVDEEGYFIATEDDYNYAKIPLLKTVSNILTIPLTSKQKKILDIFKGLENKEWTVTELEPSITFISRRRLSDKLDKLVELGFLGTDNKDVQYEKEIGGVVKLVKGRSVTTYSLKSVMDFKLPSFNEIMSNTSSMTNMSNKSITSNTNNDSVDMDILDNKDLTIQDKKIEIEEVNINLSKEVKQKILDFFNQNKEFKDKELLALNCSRQLDIPLEQVKIVFEELNQNE